MNVRRGCERLPELWTFDRITNVRSNYERSTGSWTSDQIMHVWPNNERSIALWTFDRTFKVETPAQGATSAMLRHTSPLKPQFGRSSLWSALFGPKVLSTLGLLVPLSLPVRCLELARRRKFWGQSAIRDIWVRLRSPLPTGLSQNGLSHNGLSQGGLSQKWPSKFSVLRNHVGKAGKVDRGIWISSGSEKHARFSNPILSSLFRVAVSSEEHNGNQAK